MEQTYSHNREVEQGVCHMNQGVKCMFMYVSGALHYYMAAWVQERSISS